MTETMGRVADNKHRALVLVAACGAFAALVVALVALLLAAPVAAVFFVALLVALLVGAAVWWASAPLALRFLHARPADPARHARLFNLVESLGANAGVAPPAVFVVPAPGLNALTLGRSPRHASLVVTSGLLDQLSRIELEAVLAHELSHIRADDILTATVAVVFGLFGRPARAATGEGLAALIGYLVLPLSALAGFGLRFSIDPHREELADSAGVHLTRYPPALVSALEKMQRVGTIVGPGSASPATAHLWLGGPLPPPPSGRLAWLSRLYDTHPPLGERIEALREL